MTVAAVSVCMATACAAESCPDSLTGGHTMEQLVWAPEEQVDCEADGSAERGVMRYRGFVGGMMIHSGFVLSDDLTITSQYGQSMNVGVSGTPFGVGGAIKFMFGRHLRLGTEGYVSTLRYGEHSSHARTGWGGLLADCAWTLGRCRLFVGGTVGGGSQANTTILSPVRDDYVAEEFISYRKYGFMALAPFAGVEIAVSGKVNLVAKIDYLLNLSGSQADFVTGPRLYLGFMFGHAE